MAGSDYVCIYVYHMLNSLPTLNMALWLAKFFIYATSITSLICNARTLYRSFQNGIVLDVACQRESLIRVPLRQGVRATERYLLQ